MSVSKKVTLCQTALVRQSYPTDDITYKFLFSVLDASYVGTPREKSSCSYHTINESITFEVLVNWRFLDIATLDMPEEKRSELLKVLFWYAKEHIKTKIQAGDLSKEETYTLTRDTAEDRCPFDQILDLEGFTFCVDAPEAQPKAYTDAQGQRIGNASVSTTLKPTLGAGQRWAVLAGADMYEDSANYGQLHVCVSDVEAIRDQLISSGFDPARIRVLTDHESELPTRAKMLTALQAVANATERDDLLVFYYSGHGDESNGQSYLVARDGHSLTLADTAVPLSRVREIIENAPASGKVVMLDACHSGANIKGAKPMPPDFIQRVFEQAEGIATLAACKQGEFSYEWPEQNRSVFTRYLLKALQGEADWDDKGFVTVQDASRYVVDGVKLWASQRNISQTPTLQCTMAGDIILARYRSSTAKPIPQARPSSSPELVLEFVTAGRVHDHCKQIDFQYAKSGYPQIFSFGFVLKNKTPLTKAKDIRIRVEFSNRTDTQHALYFQSPPNCPEWMTTACELSECQPAIMNFKSEELQSVHRYPEEWSDFQLKLNGPANGHLLVTYDITSIDPLTEHHDELKIELSGKS